MPFGTIPANVGTIVSETEPARFKENSLGSEDEHTKTVLALMVAAFAITVVLVVVRSVYRYV